MPGMPSPPANITVVIGQPGNVGVTVSPLNPRVSTIDYGGRTLESATDLNVSQAAAGDVIVFNGTGEGFSLESVANSTLPNPIDGGNF